jgi:hypothetical protein
LENFRVQSPFFTTSYPEDNVFGVTEDIDIPQKSFADGYWVLVKGLTPGQHMIEFTGTVPPSEDLPDGFKTHVTYHLTIEPDNDNNYGSNDNGYGNNYYN